MKKSCFILLTILLIFSLISSSSASGYTLREKMDRQLLVGSGLKGSFAIHANADPELNSFVHSIQNAEFEIRGIRNEENQHFYIYQPGENEELNALTEYCKIDGKEYFRSDFLEDRCYLFPGTDHLINSWLHAEGENPSVFPVVLRSILNISDEDELNTESLERQLEVMLSSFSSEPSVQNLDGSPCLTQTFRIPVEDMYNTVVSLINTISSNELYMSYFREILTKDQISLYLNPNLGYYYLDAMKQLDSEGDIVFSRTVSTLGDLIHSSLVLPMNSGKTGYTSLVFSSTEERKSIYLKGPSKMLYADLPLDFDLKTDEYENEELRLAFIDLESEMSNNFSLHISVSKKSEKNDSAEDGKIHEKEIYTLKISKNTDNLPEDISTEMIPDMASAEAEITIHFSSKPQLSSPTTLEVSCKIKHGRFAFDLEGNVKTSSPWLFAPFDTSNPIDTAGYTIKDFLKLKDTIIRNADGQLIRIPEETVSSDTSSDSGMMENSDIEEIHGENSETSDSKGSDGMINSESTNDSDIENSLTDAEPIEEEKESDPKG